mmetsp:Transcript_67863/g.155679  ORF Transcript_67863/g.155679 Transcript_67863/m.155679 type:complete len:139 (+) Transcript_67863:1766-2182(+)
MSFGDGTDVLQHVRLGMSSSLRPVKVGDAVLEQLEEQLVDQEMDRVDARWAEDDSPAATVKPDGYGDRLQAVESAVCQMSSRLDALVAAQEAALSQNTRLMTTVQEISLNSRMSQWSGGVDRRVRSPLPSVADPESAR